MQQQVGSCPICGAPIYVESPWHGTIPAPPVYSCWCRLGQTIIYPTDNPSYVLNYKEVAEEMKHECNKGIAGSLPGIGAVIGGGAKVQSVGDMILDEASRTCNRARELACLLEERLSSILEQPTPCDPSTEGTCQQTFPPYFSALRDTLAATNTSLNNIEYTISRIRL
jgi:hypothetical protein